MCASRARARELAAIEASAAPNGSVGGIPPLAPPAPEKEPDEGGGIPEPNEAEPGGLGGIPGVPGITIPPVFVGPENELGGLALCPEAKLWPELVPGVGPETGTEGMPCTEFDCRDTPCAFVSPISRRLLVDTSWRSYCRLRLRFMFALGTPFGDEDVC